MFTGMGTAPDYPTGCASPMFLSSFHEYSRSLKMGGWAIYLRDIPSTTHIFYALAHMALITLSSRFRVAGLQAESGYVSG